MAQSIEGSDRHQPMLLPAAVDDCVSSASPVRAIDAFVDSLDLPALGFKTRNDCSEGRSSDHPGSLLKLYLWGYLKRTRSSRGLENARAENLQAIWLIGNLRPDHSTVSDFRKNHTAALKGILREFNLICFSLRLFGRELGAIDGTFIKAVNSSARSFTKAKLDHLSSKPSTSPSPATSTKSNSPIKTKTRPAPALLPPKAQPPNSSANSPKSNNAKPF
jgi:transposase